MPKTKKPPKINRTVRLEPALNGFLADVAGQNGTVTDVITHALEEYRVRYLLEQRVRESALANMQYPTADAFREEMERRGNHHWQALVVFAREKPFDRYVSDVADSYIKEWRKREPDKREAYLEFLLEMEFYTHPGILNMPIPFTDNEGDI